MVYSYTPTYYSTLHDSITSLCKSILPLGKRRLPPAERKLSKRQSDNLKWQQDSFHQILKLMALHKEGILEEREISTFRNHLLETLIASPAVKEHPIILRDKLVFLKELLYAKCISEDEYHSSKRPILQQLAAQGAEIEVRDVVVASRKDPPRENSEEEWSVIDLKDENSIPKNESSGAKSKPKKPSAIRQQIKDAASVFGFMKNGRGNDERSIFEIEAERSACSENAITCSAENPFWDFNTKNKESETQSILMQESTLTNSSRQNCAATGCSVEKPKRKPFKALFVNTDSGEGGHSSGGARKASKPEKKQWSFDGLKKWKRNNDSENETSPLCFAERSDSEAFSGSYRLVPSPVGEGPDTKQIKKKLLRDGHPSDFFIDKVLGKKIKKELTRIQAELSTANPGLVFSDDQLEAISTRLPVDKAGLRDFFPKSWCERYGDVVVDVVRREFKEHVGEMESKRIAARDKRISGSKRWTTFDDDENSNPNLFAREKCSNPFLEQKLFTS